MTSNPLAQRSGESEWDYMKRLQQMAAQDPSEWPTTNDDDNEEETKNDENEKKKTGYVRVEEWEAQQQEKQAAIKKSLQWEERLRFDGQRYGNKSKQNDILRKNLFS